MFEDAILERRGVVRATIKRALDGAVTALTEVDRNVARHLAELTEAYFGEGSGV